MADFSEWLLDATDGECKAKAQEVAKDCADFYTPAAPLECLRLVHGTYIQPGDYPWLDAVLAGVPLDEKLAQLVIGFTKRVQEPKFWSRRFKVAAIRAAESREIRWGYIGKIGAYLSNASLERMVTRKQQSDAAIAEAQAVSPSGELIDLQKLIDASVANPKNRRLELIVRMKGLAEWAQRRGLIGYAVTLTAPSKYHRLRTVQRPNAKAKDGIESVLLDNPKWGEFTPRDTAKYLSFYWAETRALLAKEKIDIAGLRTCEPHQDGTPHWHMVIFMQPKESAKVLKVIRDKFLEVDGDERGAQERRVLMERIRTTKVKDLTYAAVAYAIGYISKNLDGHGVGMDTEAGIDAISGAQRATAWARVWGIRQFQTFGAPSITVYRELRKIRDEARNILIEMQAKAEKPVADAIGGILNGNVKPLHLAATEAMRMGRADVLEKLTIIRNAMLEGMGEEIKGDAYTLGECWKAADKGQFRRYIDAMEKTPVGLLREETVNGYGETVKVIRGLVAPSGVEVITREEGWHIRWGGKGFNAAEQRRAEAQPIAPRTCGNNCNRASGNSQVLTEEHVKNAEKFAAAAVAAGQDWHGGGVHDLRQRGIEEFTSELMRENRAIRRNLAENRKPKYSFFNQEG